MSTTKETVKISEKFMLGDMLTVMIDRVKRMPVGFGSMPEKDQQEFIDTFTEAAKESVRQVVKIIAADARPCMKAELESVMIKDGIKAVVKISKDSADRHELADAQGDTVLIVLTNTAKHLGGEGPKATPDQSNLHIEEE